MSYKDPNNAQRRKNGVLQEPIIASKILNTFHHYYPKKFKLEMVSENINKLEHIDCFIIGSLNKLGIDIKTSSLENNFSFTLINNYYNDYYFDKCKADFILFDRNEYGYIISVTELKKLINDKKLINIKSKFKNETSEYINIYDNDIKQYFIKYY